MIHVWGGKLQAKSSESRYESPNRESSPGPSSFSLEYNVKLLRTDALDVPSITSGASQADADQKVMSPAHVASRDKYRGSRAEEHMLTQLYRTMDKTTTCPLEIKSPSWVPALRSMGWVFRFHVRLRLAVAPHLAFGCLDNRDAARRNVIGLGWDTTLKTRCTHSGFCLASVMGWNCHIKCFKVHALAPSSSSSQVITLVRKNQLLQNCPIYGAPLLAELDFELSKKPAPAACASRRLSSPSFDPIRKPAAYQTRPWPAPVTLAVRSEMHAHCGCG
ncbi:uncharacterized protein TRIVIDRAFT_197485 [Trichoderma virens Gv29-8]|uniref:Uncharacterized protein n=1 Tax=Hypocrea virens (strain Gv29-8 / FGSC 10586) TaxID=413071 RepID=G9MH73_HYPVG|nr:uncharacterized protein TRIVIDRAFT_197485 [Trichoderma virens Gv29-8]EHK26063.1 hypothetical protein TRIVIDRAFT_197485 [Trichoderma virens Gv29-8]UKZ46249.1 hypothetical protein TrVGV298_000450 [Trichoderma virens]